MKFFLVFVVCFLTNFVFSQMPSDSIKVNLLKEVIISESKPFGQTVFSFKTDSINQKSISFLNTTTPADLLQSSGTLAVQKSQQGGGSPIIRGFEASRVLLVVDGIRMNNLIYRSGHLQNIISVDNYSIENIKIYNGATSTQYGSDALGGTIAFYTVNPKLNLENTSNFSGSLTARYATINNENVLSGKFNFSKKNWAMLTLFTYQNLDDLKMGKRKNGSNNFFGERPYYVANENGSDVVIENSNKYLQKFSGYKQYNFLQKILLEKPKAQHLLNLQYSTTSNIPRYDRLTDIRNNTLRFSEWYYGPQKRYLAHYNLKLKNFAFSEDVNINLAYQNAKESRHERKFNDAERLNRFENVNVFSIDFNQTKKTNKYEIIYGLESYFENANSTAYAQNILTNEKSLINTRYPDGNNIMSRNDVFLNFYKILNSNTSLSGGVRTGYTILKSTINNNSFFNFPFTHIIQKNYTYSGSLGLVHKASKNAVLKTNISSGYRVPNIDDLAKIFDTANGFLIVPNENIKPEKTLTSDFGLELNSSKKHIHFSTTYYYTKIFNAIVADNFKFNGNNSILYQGEEAQILANQNKQKAFITGFSSDFKLSILKKLKFDATFNYTLGRITGKENKPLDHIPPYYGKIGLNFSHKIFEIDAYMLYNGRKNIKDYYLNGEDNEQYAPKNGMPSWQTYNIKTSLAILKNTTLYFGVENILDTQYRVFASGINAPGRNFYSSLSYQF